jgi:hypothetical protein
MNREMILQEYYDIYDSDTTKARNLIKKLDYKNDHYLLQCIAQTYFDEAKFDQNGIWNKSSDNRKLRMAERYIVKAFKIKPTCSDVLWTLGKIRWDYGQMDVAIWCFREIIRLGIRGIVYGGCKKELSIGLAQINDSKFQLYRLYYVTNPSLSKRYLKLYKKGLAKGISTLYEPLEKFLMD